MFHTYISTYNTYYTIKRLFCLLQHYSNFLPYNYFYPFVVSIFYYSIKAVHAVTFSLSVF